MPLEVTPAAETVVPTSEFVTVSTLFGLPFNGEYTTTVGVFLMSVGNVCEPTKIAVVAAVKCGHLVAEVTTPGGFSFQLNPPLAHQ